MNFGGLAVCFCIFISISSSGVQCSISDGWVNIELHHAVDYDEPEKFSYRGNITIPSLSSGLSTIVQESLTEQQRRSLKDFAESNDFYRLKAVVAYSNNLPKQTFLTSTKACALILSQLNDVLWISTDNNGFVTAITLTTSSPEESDCEHLQLPTEEDFNTDVLVRHCEIAPLPDTASFIQKIEREREARERGEVRDNRGFFAKYWMYIVPVVALVLISGASNQEAAK